MKNFVQFMQRRIGNINNHRRSCKAKRGGGNKAALSRLTGAKGQERQSEAKGKLRAKEETKSLSLK